MMDDMQKLRTALDGIWIDECGETSGLALLQGGRQRFEQLTDAQKVFVRSKLIDVQMEDGSTGWDRLTQIVKDEGMSNDLRTIADDVRNRQTVHRSYLSMLADAADEGLPNESAEQRRQRIGEAVRPGKTHRYSSMLEMDR